MTRVPTQPKFVGLQHGCYFLLWIFKFTFELCFQFQFLLKVLWSKVTFILVKHWMTTALRLSILAELFELAKNAGIDRRDSFRRLILLARLVLCFLMIISSCLFDPSHVVFSPFIRHFLHFRVYSSESFADLDDLLSWDNKKLSWNCSHSCWISNVSAFALEDVNVPKVWALNIKVERDVDRFLFMTFGDVMEHLNSPFDDKEYLLCKLTLLIDDVFWIDLHWFK